MTERKEQAILICMPLARCVEQNGPGAHVIEHECFVCHGKVGINPITFETKGVPADFAPICGGCAVDYMDATPDEENEFRLTESQQHDPRIAAIKQLKGAGWGKAAVDYVRRNRALYDARPSAPTGMEN